MCLKILVFFILLSLVHNSKEATQPYLDLFLTHPDEVVYGDEGSNVTLEWNFHIGSWPNPRPKVTEFVFGEWAFPGYVGKKILYVQGHNQVYKRPGFEKKLDWRGNIYECVKCKAVVVMYNLTRADFKSYGVDIELGMDRSPLTNSLRLVKKGTQLDRILTHPDEVVYRDEGSNVFFEWNFQIGSWPNPRPKVVRFVFGEWARPGYVRKTILYVRGHNQVNKRRGFEKKVDWRGNIYKCIECKAVVVMYKLTRADFKSYGVDIELGVDRSPLTNWLKLVKRGTQLDRIFTHPDEVVYRDEGSNVSFEWNFQIGSWPNPRPKVVKFVFGEWALPGYVRKTILYVQGHNQVKKRPGFEKKVDWRGNVYKCVNCKAVVVMYNLTRADFKSYGVDIELGVDRSPLTNWLRLVKREPAILTKWTQNIEVNEGNSTNIECRASGLPPPSVKIKRNSQTLQACNDMKPCVYKIQAARSEDQGEYVCLVQQENPSVIISRSLNLKVLRTRKTSAANIDERISPNTTSPSITSATRTSKLTVLKKREFSTRRTVDERLSPNTTSPSSPSTAPTHSLDTTREWLPYLAILLVVVLI